MQPATTALDLVLPAPRLLEVDSVDLAVPPARAWEVVRHGCIGDSLLSRALFAIRTLPSRLHGADVGSPDVRLDDLVSTPKRPGFGILVEEPGVELVVGAIGKVWHLDIPFIHVAGLEAFTKFREPGWVKVAWALRVAPLGERDCRLSVEVRVDATDEASWKRFRRYFRLIGPGSHFIRRATFSGLARRLGTPEGQEEARPLPGDELLPDATAQITHGVTIAAPPEAIWPWLVQMGGRRAGFYAIDLLDNGGQRSAREIHPELQAIRVGDVLPATPEGRDGFEVLSLAPNRALVIGGLFDREADHQLQFGAARPDRFWHITWAFVLEPLGPESTRLHVRARAAFPAGGRFHAAWIRPVHALMERSQLAHLAARVEGRLAAHDWRDIGAGLGGGAIILAAMTTPFLREARSRWGLSPDDAARAYPGDDRVANPTWTWTHGIEIDAPMRAVWPWIAQIGADRGGFYSYQWLENLGGCNLRNAETIHREWAARAGGALSLHPKMPPMPIADFMPGRWFVGHHAVDEAARAEGMPWAEVSWLFYLEPLGPERCRFVSRYRCATSPDLLTRLQFGPTLLEPIGFAMDRRMLLGVKERVEGEQARQKEEAARTARRIATGSGIVR